MTVSNAAKSQMIGKFINSFQGRQKIAASMQQPLRERRDYAAVGRKAFLVEELPDGALPYYDKDPDVTAFVISEGGESISSLLVGERVQIPTFEIASRPEVSLSEIRQRRYDVLERMQKQGASMIQAAEDERAFAIMDAVAADGFGSSAAVNPDIPLVAPLTKSSLADAYGAIESHGLQVARVFMNPRDFTDIRKYGNDMLDPDSQRSLLQVGSLGSIWGAALITTRLIPEGTVYLTTEPEFFGRIPVRQELTVLSADNPAARTIGFSVFEELGIGCHNPRGLQRMIIAR